MLKKTGVATPPIAAKRDSVSEHHGIVRHDPYAWLKAENWQEVMRSPERLAHDIRRHLEDENAYCDAELERTRPLQERLFAEMKGRIREDDSSVPSPDGPYAYGTRYVTGGQQPLIVRTARAGGDERVLVDGNREANGQAFFRFGGTGHSPDHRLIAWSFDDKGSELYRIRVRDAATGEDLPDVIEGTSGAAIWSADSRALFYVLLDENHRPSKLMRHVLGTPVEADALIFEETDPGFFLGVGKTLDGRFIVIHTHDHETSEVHLLDAADLTASPMLVARREQGIEYSVEARDDQLYILTNASGAEDFEIVTAPIATPDRAHWKTLAPHAPGTLILATTVLKDFLIRLERKDGLPRIVVRDLATGAEHAIAFDEEAYSLGLSDGYEFDTATIRFTYSSMTTPAQVFDYDVRTRTRVLRKTQEVPSGHDPRAYTTRRLFAAAHDGEQVPVTMLYRNDTPLDGSAPVWLYGYGAYGITIPAAFNTNILSLVDRGFIYAIAHIRGGKDKGYHWYRDGKRAQKPNTFRDFVSVGEFLVAKGFTRSGTIVAQGGSAGGLLMGAVVNLAPDLFSGIIAEVPFVDALCTMLDDTLPLTPPEFPEWGNPIASRADYDLIASYSPYDNVRRTRYPHILATAGLTDPRVMYWEPAKWVAKLRELNESENLVLLHTRMEAGHAGSPGRFDRLKEVALVYAFGLLVAGKAD
ncbi:MAG: S9 family peptidase [Hyphomicrobiales bacterium]